jgi:hypothetical protein
MAYKSMNYYLIKLVRLSGWVLVPIMLTYICTGFALHGKFGFSKIIDAEQSLDIRRLLEWPLVIAFTVHAATTTYFAMRRWGWIKKRTRP